ncbi:MAG: iron-sulfur cluster insertion protein ErpA [bacterium]|nr:iron-sulfur cluster insertion protein ErpA [bacterium]
MLTITDDAVLAIKNTMIEENTKHTESYLRVGVRGGGCSGLQYDLSFETEKREGDAVIEKDGVRLLIDTKSQLYLTGITLDYTTGLNGKGYVFTNPNATSTCGCGESFSV